MQKYWVSRESKDKSIGKIFNEQKRYKQKERPDIIKIFKKLNWKYVRSDKITLSNSISVGSAGKSIGCG